MPFCPNPECPHRKSTGRPAENILYFMLGLSFLAVRYVIGFSLSGPKKQGTDGKSIRQAK